MITSMLMLVTGPALDQMGARKEGKNPQMLADCLKLKPKEAGGQNRLTPRRLRCFFWLHFYLVQL
jgi:hypothetical protein